MFTRVFTLLPLAFLASASLVARNDCSTGDQHCCESVLDQEEAIYNFGDSILSIIDGLEGQVGINCVPIVGNACSQSAVCCQNVAFNGLINAGCNSITL